MPVTLAMLGSCLPQCLEIYRNVRKWVSVYESL